MRIAIAQMDIAWEDRAVNYERVAEHAVEAKNNNAELLILPEMFSTGFSLNTAATAEEETGPSPLFLKDLAKTNNIGIVAGVAFRGTGGKVRNSALVLDRSGNEIARYTKMQLFSFANENEAHEAGVSPVVFTFEGMTFAPFICYDLRFPSLFRSVNEKSEVLIVIASWPESRQRHWDILLAARAVENQAYVVGVNRVGEGGGLSYTGGSRVIDPMGETIADAGADRTVICADLKKDRVRKIREEMPFLKDRRLPCIS